MPRTRPRFGLERKRRPRRDPARPETSSPSPARGRLTPRQAAASLGVRDQEIEERRHLLHEALDLLQPPVHVRLPLLPLGAPARVALLREVEDGHAIWLPSWSDIAAGTAASSCS